MYTTELQKSAAVQNLEDPEKLAAFAFHRGERSAAMFD